MDCTASSLRSVFLAEASLSREVFGNIPGGSKLIFYLLAALALGIFACGVFRRARLWKLGRERGHGRPSLAALVLRVLSGALLQRKVHGRALPSVAHALLFGGFIVLLIGTVLIGIEHGLAAILGRGAGDPVFHKGVYYAVYEVVLDAFGLAFLAGGALFVLRRWRRPPSVGHHHVDWAVLVALLLIGVTGYVLEGLRVVIERPAMPGFSFVGYALSSGIDALGTTEAIARTIHHTLWWFHAVLALGLIASIPSTRVFHAVAGVLQLSREGSPLGWLEPISIEDVEKGSAVGVGRIQDFTRGQLVSLDACVSCGRCEDACPAHEAGKPLSPRDVVQDLKRHLEEVGATLSERGMGNSEVESCDSARSLHGDVVQAETVWACTICSACSDVCPLGVQPVEMITDLRRHLLAEGEIRGAPAQALQKMQRSGNPWGFPARERIDWAEGLDVPTVESNPGFEVLYWVGCAASYDRRVQKIARAVVELLRRAGVDFAVLGSAERCTGESARRMGEEFTFQELARENIATLKKHRTRKIVTHCPHCLNSFRRDYPQFGGHYEVAHHSEFLRDLMESGELRVAGSASQPGAVTYHDPCYLSRIHGICNSPRELLGAARGEGAAERLVEMPRNRELTSCCGGGGGRMWFDDRAGERTGAGRVREALSSGADTVATSCPFCLIMLTDGVAAERGPAEVRDIAEILLEACRKDA